MCERALGARLCQCEAAPTRKSGGSKALFQCASGKARATNGQRRTRFQFSHTVEDGPSAP